MSNRIAAYAAAAFLLASVAPAFAGEASLANLTSTVDRPLSPIQASPAAAAATQTPGSVGAMHYAVDGVASSLADVQRQGGNATAGTVRWLAVSESSGS